MKIFKNGNRVFQNLNSIESDYLLFFADICQKEEILEEYVNPLLQAKAKIYSKDEMQQSYFQKFSDYCYFYIYLPETDAIEIYLLQNRLFFILRQPESCKKLWENIEADKENLSSPEKTLFSFFYQLFIPEMEMLSNLEDSIEELEEKINVSLQAQFDQLWQIRKELLQRKRYVASLSMIADSLEEYQNELFPSRNRNFQFISAQLERLNQTILHLSDYISHVQDVCQAQADIALNRSMNFLTIVTAIFLPLTLLVGWYGMNFDMPEYNFKYSYPFIILLSILIIVLIIRFFKRKKWL